LYIQHRAQDIDPAVLDRCDESLYFPLPDHHCRSKLLNLYYEQCVHKTIIQNNALASTVYYRIRKYLAQVDILFMSIESEFLTKEKKMEKIVTMTKGFSGREIGKLMISIQSSLYASDSGSLTSQNVMDLIDVKVKEHLEKENMIQSNLGSTRKSLRSGKENQDQSIKGEMFLATPSAPSAVKRVSSAFNGVSEKCDTVMHEVKQLF